MTTQRHLIRVLTSCTGVKARDEAPAEELYQGQQHLRLMRGVCALRASGAPVDLDLWILSAGHGLLPGNQRLAPYESTFAAMTRREARSRARALQIPARVRDLLALPANLTLILLGDDYMTACELDRDVRLASATLALCARTTSLRLPPLERLRTLELGTTEARRFSCGLIGLKGEVARRLLGAIAHDPALIARATAPGLLDELAASPAPSQLAVAL